MPKFKVRWIQTVSEYWYVEVEAKNETEAKQKWIDGSYLDEEQVLDDSTVECTDFDCVEPVVKIAEDSYLCDDCQNIITKKQWKKNQGLCDFCIDKIN